MTDRLREALETWDDYKGIVWQQVADEPFAAISRSMDAARKVVSGFSPEAVQAAAKALYDLDDVSVETWEDAAYVAEVRAWYERMAQAALAAAWATNFGGDPS